MQNYMSNPALNLVQDPTSLHLHSLRFTDARNRSFVTGDSSCLITCDLLCRKKISSVMDLFEEEEEAKPNTDSQATYYL